MTKDEALKLALEALRQIDEAMPFPVAKLAQKAIKEALAQQETPNEIGKRVAREGGGLSSLWSAVSHDSDLPEAQRGYEEALAQPEQDWIERERAVGYREGHQNALKQMAQPEQEPVASIFISGIGEREFDDWGIELPMGRNLLYTTPPQRTWIGLTDDERIDLMYESGGNEIVAIQITEAKLKEKNT